MDQERARNPVEHAVRAGTDAACTQDRHFTLYEDSDGREAKLAYVGKKENIPEGARRFALIVDTPESESKEIYQVVVFTGNVESGGARDKKWMNEDCQPATGSGVRDRLHEKHGDADRGGAGGGASYRQDPAARPNLAGIVHFGLVEYRDAPPNGDFAARVLCRLDEDFSFFERKLNGLEYSSRGKDDWPDDVVAGLSQAVSETDVGWSPNSTKHVILLGDCPAKETYDKVTKKEQQTSTGKSLDDILDEAQPSGAVPVSNIWEPGIFTPSSTIVRH